LKLHKPPFILKEIKIEVTHQCPLDCVHCSSDASNSCQRTMTDKKCKEIINEAIGMGIKEIAFSGGEPLVWPHIEKAVEYACKNGAKVLIYTSGNVSNINKRLKNLKSLGVKKCILSIFGSDQEKHEKITRIYGSFVRTLEAIDSSIIAGLNTELHFVPFSDNYIELNNLALLAKEHGVSQISVLRFVPHGRGYLFQKHILNKLQNVELRKSINRLRSDGYKIRTGSPYNFILLNDQPKCSSGIDRLIIGPDLRIYPCDAFKQIKAEELFGTIDFSSLNNGSLYDCWKKSPFLNAVREYLTTAFKEPCLSCKNIERCLSGCLAQKVIAFGNFEKRPDPQCMLTNY
jgi:radical SAM protein with 4Fe4S-binding SPASM domain